MVRGFFKRETRRYEGFASRRGGGKKKRRGSSAGGRRARRRTPVNPPSLTGRRPAAVATSLRGAWGGGRGGRASGRARGETGAGGALAKNTRASEVHTRARGIWAPRADARGRTRDGGARGGRGGRRDAVRTRLSHRSASIGSATSTSESDSSDSREDELGVGDASLPLIGFRDFPKSHRAAPPQPGTCGREPRSEETGSGGARGAWNERRTRRARACAGERRARREARRRRPSFGRASF